MALFKCKMCGGSLEISPKATVIECEYCGTPQTLPKLHDEKLNNMFERADQLRRAKEFDRALKIYEEILTEKNDDSEIYWSIVLCRYGIEYVDDPSSHQMMPTVNRAQFTSIYDDADYQSAIRYADAIQRMLYEKEAATINEIQKGILAISNQEEPYDVFICYKETDDNGERTHDSVDATDLYYELTDMGYKVFFSRITLEDKLGTAYEPYIFAALNSAKVMVVLGSKPEYFNAVWVKNEWSRFLALMKNDRKRTLIPAYRNMDAYNLPREFSHLQALDMNKLGFMSDLTRGIKKIIGEKAEPQYQPQYQPKPQPQTKPQPQSNQNTKNEVHVDSRTVYTKPINQSTAKKPTMTFVQLEKQYGKNIAWGIVFLILFWPVSIVFFCRALKTYKEIKTFYPEEQKNSQLKNGKMRTSMKIWMIVCYVFSGIYILIGWTDSDPSMFALSVFLAILGLMFACLAATPKGSKYILGREKGIRKILFVLACIIIAIFSGAFVANLIDNLIDNVYALIPVASVVLSISQAII